MAGTEEGRRGIPQQLETDLDDCKRRLDLAVASGGLGTWRHDIVRDVFEMDAVALSHYGIESSHHTSLTDILDRIHPDDRTWVSAVVANAFEPARTGDLPPVEYRVLHGASEESRWLCVRVDIHFEGTGVDRHPTLALGSSMDVTERKRSLELAAAERDLSLALSEARDMRQALTSCLDAAFTVSGLTSGGIYLVDEAGGLSLSAHRGLSGAFARTVAYSAPGSANTRAVLEGQAIFVDAGATDIELDDQRSQEGLGALAILPIKDRNRVVACLNLSSKTQLTIGRWVRASLESIASRLGATIARLQAEEKRQLAEVALRESEESLRASQRVARLGHYSFDVSSGLWTSSEALDEIFGIGPTYTRDVAGWASIVHPEDRARMLAYLRESVIGAGQPFDEEYRILRASDSTERIVHGMGNLDFDAQGRPSRMFGVIQDVTERKEAGAQRQELERRLLHAQKLESLGILAGGIAHDFNNLLMGILGNLDLARQDLPSGSEADSSVERAIQATRRATDLTRQMLAYSGKGRFVIAPMDLGRLAQENASLFRTAIGHTVTFNLRLPTERAVIDADPGQVQQVVMNLITNAAEAIGDGPGVIGLSTGLEECDAALLARSRLDTKPTPGRFAFVEVSDTGCGMDKSTVERLFDPFFTTKFAGRGLGMSAVLGIVRGHKGAIFVDSAPGLGSTIRVLFPALAATAVVDDGRTPPPSVPASTGSKGSILVVDDEESVRIPCERFVRRLGYEAVGAGSGDEALRIFAERTSNIVLVVLDLTMPGRGGAGTYRELLQIDPKVRVILSSGFSEEAAMEEFGDARPAGFLQKPYPLAALRSALEEVLGDAPKTGLPGNP